MNELEKWIKRRGGWIATPKLRDAEGWRMFNQANKTTISCFRHERTGEWGLVIDTPYGKRETADPEQAKAAVEKIEQGVGLFMEALGA